MRKKLIISEEQYKALAQLNETEFYESMVNKIVDDLKRNYKKAVQTYRDGNEYKQRKVFEIIADGDVIQPNDLLTYLEGKYESVGKSFLKQLLEDWCDDKIKDGRLSKNISLGD
jgi:hypothetical protein